MLGLWDTTEQPGLRNSEINNQSLFLPLSLSCHYRLVLRTTLRFTCVKPQPVEKAARTRSALCSPFTAAVAGAVPGGFREGRSGAGAMVRAGAPRAPRGPTGDTPHTPGPPARPQKPSPTRPGESGREGGPQLRRGPQGVRAGPSLQEPRL